MQKGVSSIFEQGIKEGKFINGPLPAQSDVVWALFTGIVVWEISNKTVDPKKDRLESTLDLGFKILYRGIINRNLRIDKFVKQ